MSKNKTLIVYNRYGAACNTKFPIRYIKRFAIWTHSDHEEVVIIDTNGERHRLNLTPTRKKDIMYDGGVVEYYTTTFRIDV